MILFTNLLMFNKKNLLKKIHGFYFDENHYEKNSLYLNVYKNAFISNI